MNQTVDILCRARELYASAPSHAPVGAPMEPNSYCALMALEHAAFGAGARHHPVCCALRKAMNGAGSIPAWNAEHSTAEVLAAFDRAIAAQRLIVPPLQRAERREPVHAGQES